MPSAGERAGVRERAAPRPAAPRPGAVRGAVDRGERDAGVDEELAVSPRRKPGHRSAVPIELADEVTVGAERDNPPQVVVPDEHGPGRRRDGDRPPEDVLAEGAAGSSIEVVREHPSCVEVEHVDRRVVAGARRRNASRPGRRRGPRDHLRPRSRDRSGERVECQDGPAAHVRDEHAAPPVGRERPRLDEAVAGVPCSDELPRRELEAQDPTGATVGDEQLAPALMDEEAARIAERDTAAPDSADARDAGGGAVAAVDPEDAIAGGLGRGRHPGAHAVRVRRRGTDVQHGSVRRPGDAGRRPGGRRGAQADRRVGPDPRQGAQAERAVAAEVQPVDAEPGPAAVEVEEQEACLGAQDRRHCSTPSQLSCQLVLIQARTSVVVESESGSSTADAASVEDAIAPPAPAAAPLPGGIGPPTAAPPPPAPPGGRTRSSMMTSGSPSGTIATTRNAVNRSRSACCTWTWSTIRN